jgi:cytochrome c
MTAHPALSDADIALMVKWILLLKPSAATVSTSGANPAAAMNTDKDIYGKSVQTNVAVFTGADQKAVTPAAFNGYEAYCARCHGGDAVGGARRISAGRWPMA